MSFAADQIKAKCVPGYEVEVASEKDLDGHFRIRVLRIPSTD